MKPTHLSVVTDENAGRIAAQSTTPLQQKTDYNELVNAHKEFERLYEKYNTEFLMESPFRDLLIKRERYFMDAEVHAGNAAMALKHASIISKVLNLKQKAGHSDPTATIITQIDESELFGPNDPGADDNAPENPIRE